MMKWLKYINIALLFLLCEPASAQSDRNFIRSGNKLYRQQNYAKAEIEYRKALAKNPSNPQAMYNLGCALLMQQKDKGRHRTVAECWQNGDGKTSQGKGIPQYRCHLSKT